VKFNRSSTSTTRKKAAGNTTKKAKDATAKLAYQMTDEETDAHVEAKVKKPF
jgi:hypothetical protein